MKISDLITKWYKHIEYTHRGTQCYRVIRLGMVFLIPIQSPEIEYTNDMALSRQQPVPLEPTPIDHDEWKDLVDRSDVITLVE